MKPAKIKLSETTIKLCEELKASLDKERYLIRKELTKDLADIPLDESYEKRISDHVIKETCLMRFIWNLSNDISVLLKGLPK